MQMRLTEFYWQESFYIWQKAQYNQSSELIYEVLFQAYVKKNWNHF